ncbi:MAG: GAF domain-containing protein, partial [Bacteroidetes bacterium]|nr:GAF domain-containing protein [Bacteroidota bacterium]
QGLAAELDFQAIVDLVGDKLSEVMGTGDLGISWYDEKANLVHYLYVYEHGERLTISPIPPTPGGQLETILKNRKPIVWNTPAEYIGGNVPGTDQSKSLATIPIISSDRVLGSISIENFERENAYGESELRLLTTIAASLGTALENARLFDETQRLFKAEQERVAELQIINSMQQGLAAELDFQAIVDLVGDKLKEVFKTNDLSIRWYDEKANAVHFLYEFEHGERITVPVQQPPSPGGSFDQFLKDRKPILGNTAEIMARTGGTTIPGTDTSKSLISVPIIGSDHVIGSLQMENYERENAFGESELRLLTTIAASLGTALENARLFDEVQKKNTEISEALEQQTATGNVLRVIASSPTDIRPVLDAVAENAARLCEADDVQIYQVDGDKLRQVTHFGPLPALQDGESLPLVPGLVTGRAVLERRTIHIEDTLNLSASEYPESIKLQKRLSHRTTIATPLLKEGNAIGAIVVRRNIVRPFTEKQIALLSTFADQSAIAIENVRLFNETTRLLKITEERNAELAIINSVQAALAAELNIQGIYDAVGDKIREIFNNKDVGIRIYDTKTNLVHYPYFYENGTRLEIESNPLGDKGIEAHVFRTRETIVINENLKESVKKFESQIIPGTEIEKSVVYVPLVVGDQARGLISLNDMENEHAFSESDVRLLQTLANSMSIALENARLFDETQRLLKVTEERNAELAIINSVQAGLVSKLDMQAIYELVGEKLSDVLHSHDIDIRLFDVPNDKVYYPYLMEKGVRFEIEPSTFSGMSRYVYETKQMLVVNEDLPGFMKKVGSNILPGTQMEKSFVGLPITSR